MKNNPKEENTIDINYLDNVGKIDINFPEFCFGTNGQMNTRLKQNEIVYNLKPLKRKTQFGRDIEVARTVIIKRSSDGFPTQRTRDVLLALIRIAKRNNDLESDTFACTVEDIISELNLVRGGKNSQLILKSLDILMNTQIKFKHSFFDMEKKADDESLVTFHILAGYKTRKISNIDITKYNNERYTRGCIVWNKIFFETVLFESRNLIDYDFNIYTSLDGDITKQLFQYLSKICNKQKVHRVQLRTLAYIVLGIANNGDSRSRKHLRFAHSVLMKRGLLNVEPIFYKNEDNVEMVQYTLNRNSFLASIERKPKKKKSQVVNPLDLTGQVAKDYKNFKEICSDPEQLKQILKNTETDELIFSKEVNTFYEKNKINNFTLNLKEHANGDIGLYMAIVEKFIYEGKKENDPRRKILYYTNPANPEEGELINSFNN